MGNEKRLRVSIGTFAGVLAASPYAAEDVAEVAAELKVECDRFAVNGHFYHLVIETLINYVLLTGTRGNDHAE